MKVSVGIILHNESVFVGKRKKTKIYPDYYEFPGGKIEHEESGKMAIIRELKEELSIHVTKVHFLFETTSHYKEFSVLLKVYLIEEYLGAISPTNEYDEWEFCKISNLNSIKLLPGNQEMVRKLIELGIFYE